MGVKKFKPTSPGYRNKTGFDFSELTRSRPERSLLKPLKKTGGRSKGSISIRHKGGGHKRRYRLIDFKRLKTDVPAKVISIEYDPNRGSRIALLHYVDGLKSYILAPLGLGVGDMIVSGDSLSKVDIRPGNSLPLQEIPTGTTIHNIELRPGKGAQFARGAGVGAVLVAKEKNYCQVQLPSQEVRKVLSVCRATIGQIGNIEHNNVNWGKAGRSRYKGIRPTVRGMAMNPIDHPLGGGEGVSKGNHPMTPWGKSCKGKKTRNNKRTDSMIVRRRKRKGR